MPLILAFTFLLLLSFGLLAFFMQPTQEQKAVQRRVAAIKLQEGVSASLSQDLEQYLAHKPSGSFKWLEGLVESTRRSQQMQTLILQSDVRTNVGTVMMWSGGLGLGAAGIAFLVTGTLVLASAAGAIAGLLPTFYLKFRRSRRINAFDKNLPESIEMMTRSLRAGHSVAAAISIIGEQALEPNRTEFNEVFKKQNYGLPMREALTQMLERVPSQDLRVLVTAILVQKDTGGNLAEILERTVHVIRERIRIQGEIRTHTAQGRMTGWILCALPIVMLGLISIINPGYADVLLREGLGRKLLYVALGLLCMGGLVIRQIINGIEV